MPREFVICKAQAYHSGFNVGFNIAEAINFATPSWLKIAEQGINFCQCEKHNVRFDLGKILARTDNELSSK